MDHDQSIPEQLSFFDLPEGPGVGPNQARVLLRRRLDTVSHWAPYGRRKGAPRVYEFPGAHEQLLAAPSAAQRAPASVTPSGQTADGSPSPRYSRYVPPSHLPTFNQARSASRLRAFLGRPVGPPLRLNRET
jgi:hypothetical protein